MIVAKTRELSIATNQKSRAIPRNPGILIADDMALILTLLKFELESRGSTVWLAVDGDDALDLYRRNCAAIDLVLLDVQMPGLDGPHTLAALQRLNPGVLACFMTGNSGIYSEEDLLERGAVCVFNKPFRPHDVAQSLEKLLESENSSSFPALSPQVSGYSRQNRLGMHGANNKHLPAQTTVVPEEGM